MAVATRAVPSGAVGMVVVAVLLVAVLVVAVLVVAVLVVAVLVLAVLVVADRVATGGPEASPAPCQEPSAHGGYGDARDQGEYRVGRLGGDGAVDP